MLSYFLGKFFNNLFLLTFQFCKFDGKIKMKKNHRIKELRVTKISHGKGMTKHPTQKFSDKEKW